MCLWNLEEPSGLKSNVPRAQQCGKRKRCDVRASVGENVVPVKGQRLSAALELAARHIIK